MGYLEIFITALGVSMDAAAVAVCLGLGMKKAGPKNMAIVGLYFGIFQGAMPLIGYFVASLFADKITSFDHWVAFAMLAFLGTKMILESLKKDEKVRCKDRECPAEVCTDRDCPKVLPPTSLSPKKMLPYAFATSIDALAVGVSFAVLDVEVFSAAGIIAGVTLLLSMVGVKIGNLFGTKIKSKAEMFGGIILILIGGKILIEHLFF